MYRDFFGFKDKPFYISPDPDFFFGSPKHQEALSCMQFSLQNKVGISLLSGDIGIGKTTLIQQLLQLLEPHIRAACVTNTNVTPEQFLILVANAFGTDVPIANKAGAVKILEHQLRGIQAEGKSPLLIIDDAQNLSMDALDEVRWLSNLQYNKDVLVQIMLVAQPELRTKLQHPSMASLAQRISIGYHLRPFTRKETHAYIHHRIAVVDGPKNLFTPAAIDLIYTTTHGIPRTINLLSDNALVYGFADELNTIDAPSVQQAIDEIGGYGVGFDTPPTAGASTASSDDRPASNMGGRTCEGDAEIANRLHRLETRVELLDRVFGLSNKELLNTIKRQLDQERRAKDKLLIELIRLKHRYESLKKKSAAYAAPGLSKKN